MNSIDLESKYLGSPPKVIGGYKKQGWATKILDRISNETIETEGDELLTAKAVLMAKDNTYYPAFMSIDPKENGKVIGIYMVSEDEEHFELIPFELAIKYMKIKQEDLVPFRYRTLNKIEGDQYQTNWPDFT
jgi:hypothetical protein